jgi:hypothetical protein
VDVTAALDAAIRSWVASGTADVPPKAVTLNALYQQRLYLMLSGNLRLARETISHLPSTLLPRARDTVAAYHELRSLTAPTRRTSLTVGAPTPARDLRRDYRQAEQRFGVSWSTLAAINFVESAFGRVRSPSGAGAQGPMQFEPSTWAAYGLGGDVHQPRDAILGAANYLRASGFLTNERQALYSYNPSPKYVDAVIRYAREMLTDPAAFYSYYAWQVFARTTAGVRQLTGPGHA